MRCLHVLLALNTNALTMNLLLLHVTVGSQLMFSRKLFEITIQTRTSFVSKLTPELLVLIILDDL
jgi:hypothetical protein